MKQRIIGILTAVLVLCGVFCLCMESRYSRITYVDADMTTAEILAEKPALARGERDFALEEYVLDLPEVQALLAETESEDGRKAAAVSEEEAASLLSGWMETGWQVLELAASGGNSVYVSFEKEEGGTERISYIFFADGSYPMQKSIGVYKENRNGTRDVKAVYSIHEAQAAKSIPKRQWFYWVQYLMEERNVSSSGTE